MNKYFYLFSTLLILILNCKIQAQPTIWENISNQIPGDSTNNLADVYVPIRWEGFISSMTKPEIYRSDFSTETWEIIKTPSPVIAFYLLGYDRGIMCGVDSTVYKTTDGGENWTFFGSLGKSIKDMDIRYFPIFPGYTGYICGNNGVIGSLEDTGLVVISSGISTNFSDITSPLQDKVWLTGDSVIYFYNGDTFFEQHAFEVKLNAIYFTGELDGWVVGDYGYIAFTTDGGNQWIQKQSPDTLKRNLNDVYVIGRYGWIVGDDGLILFTYDSGTTWAIKNYWSDSGNLKRIHCAGGNSGNGPALAIGENKTVLIDPTVVSVENKSKAIDFFHLYQNYPNPFNPITYIGFQIAEPGFVSLKVYDILGKEVAKLVGEEKYAGNYEVEFNALDLPSGIYFYRLKSENFIKTKKMILLR